MKPTIYLFILVALAACSTKKKSASNTNDTSQATDSASEAIEEVKEAVQERARLIVSFYSPGNGIDNEAHQLFAKEILESNKEIKYSKVSWGREGEVDYCFQLANMTAGEQAVFVDKVMDLLRNSERIHFYENEACRENRN